MDNNTFEKVYKKAVAALGGAIILLGLMAVNVALVKCLVTMIAG